MPNQPIDKNTRFTGGAKVVLKRTDERYCSGMSDEFWGKARIAHIALQDQPLAAFVEAALSEKGFSGTPFQIAAFAPEISLIIVNADLTPQHLH